MFGDTLIGLSPSAFDLFYAIAASCCTNCYSAGLSRLTISFWNSKEPTPYTLSTGVASLVQIGIRNDPNLTISFLQSLSPSDTKAALLLEAAWALSKRQSIPVC